MITDRRKLDWLLADSCWGLWSEDTKREAMRLLVALAPKLDKEMLAELEDAILAGPPRSVFNNDIETEEWRKIEDRGIWLRLEKMSKAGTNLSDEAKERLDELSARHPKWSVAEDESDEFPFFTRESGLIDRLEDPRQKDDWRKRCHSHFEDAVSFLSASIQNKEWSTRHWGEALHAWSEEEHHQKSWSKLAPVLVDAPEDLFQDITHEFAHWLKVVSKTFEGNEEHFFKLVKQALALESDRDVPMPWGYDPVMHAINHPVGHGSEALLSWWHRQSLEDNQELKGELRSMLTELCDVKVERYRHGRVLLASRAITLFRVDPDWATEHLLPLFSWQTSSVEAQAVWRGFLWSPRLHRPLMEALKSDFLDTANHYSELGEHGKQYAQFLTLTALHLNDTFTDDELAKATGALPSEGLNASAWMLARQLENSGDQSVDYWANRIGPYLKKYWPHEQEKISPSVSLHLGRICLAAKNKFPEAFELLRPWIQTQENALHLARTLNKSELCENHPADALKFLHRIVGKETSGFSMGEVRGCLKKIQEAQPEIQENREYVELDNLARQHGAD